jgi:HEAT repeat protein
VALDALAARESDRNARLQALKSLAAAKRDPDSRDVVVEALAELITTDDHELRALVLKALTHWDWATKVDEVLPLLTHADADTRRAAIEYLGEMQDGAAAPALAERMSQTEERPQVAAALRLIGPAAEEAVLELLTHKDAEVRGEACRILAEIGGDESVAPLRKLAVRDGEPAADAAKYALRKLGHSVPQPAKKKPKPVADDDDENPFDPSPRKKMPPAEDDNENPFEPAPKKPAAARG